jgi:hypothetical protein
MTLRAIGLVLILAFALLSQANGQDSLKSLQALEIDYEQRAALMDSFERMKFLDDLALRKMDFVADQLYRLALAKIASSRKSPVALAQHQSGIEEKYQEYLRLKILYGTAKDFQRTAAYRLFVKRTFALFDFINDRKPEVGFSFKKWGSMVSAGWTVAPTLLSLVASSEERQSSSGFSRVMATIRKLTPAFFKQGIDWQGSSLITHMKNQKNDVNVIIMNHSDRHLDNVIMSTVIGELPGSSAIIALAQGWSHDFVAEVVMKNKSIVSVGERNGISYGNTTERVLETLRGGVRNLFLYPEGSTGSGIGEMKPLAPGFAKRLLPAIAARYKVQLLVMTTIDTYRILGTLRSEGPARVRLGPLLEHEGVKALLAQGPEIVDNFVRDQWRRNLSESSQKVAGQFRISELMSFIEEKVEGALCRKALL